MLSWKLLLVRYPYINYICTCTYSVLEKIRTLLSYFNTINMTAPDSQIHVAGLEITINAKTNIHLKIFKMQNTAVIYTSVCCQGNLKERSHNKSRDYRQSNPTQGAPNTNTSIWCKHYPVNPKILWG